jgi:hypothetical protein
LLAAPPRPTDDPNLFSSNTQFGEPGVCPLGTLGVVPLCTSL